jgi:hypothetical protein
MDVTTRLNPRVRYWAIFGKKRPRLRKNVTLTGGACRKHWPDPPLNSTLIDSKR